MSSNIIGVSSNTTRKTRSWARKMRNYATLLVLMALVTMPHLAWPAIATVWILSKAIIAIARVTTFTLRAPSWGTILLTILATAAFMLLIVWVWRKLTEDSKPNPS